MTRRVVAWQMRLANIGDEANDKHSTKLAQISRVQARSNKIKSELARPKMSSEPLARRAGIGAGFSIASKRARNEAHH